MDHVEAVMAIAAGTGSIVVGLRSKVFYALGPGQRPKPTTKAMPRWFGRLWFIAIGALMIYWSLPSLSGRWRWSDLWADWWLVAFFGAVWVVGSALNRMKASEPTSGIQALELEESKETTHNF